MQHETMQPYHGGKTEHHHQHLQQAIKQFELNFIFHFPPQRIPPHYESPHERRDRHGTSLLEEEALTINLQPEQSTRFEIIFFLIIQK